MLLDKKSKSKNVSHERVMYIDINVVQKCVFGHCTVYLILSLFPTCQSNKLIQMFFKKTHVSFVILLRERVHDNFIISY